MHAPLASALFALMTRCDALCGLLELRVTTDLGEQRWITSRHVDSDTEDRARVLFSSSIISDALASGELVRTAAALSDVRYADRRSVQHGQIRAVLCAPVGSPDQLGVVYLERATAFDDEMVAYVRGWSEGITPLIRRHMLHTTRRVDDPTAEARTLLDAEDFVGQSEAIARTLDQILVTRLSRAPVLITGPTGSGKSTLARIIHRSSRRKSGPFVQCNAANLRGDMVSAELFGVAAGAATSVRARGGLFAEANGGTLFLDEIALLPLETQGRLLTFLDTGSYRQVGRDRPSTADLRIVAASNESLLDLVEEGRFRRDLLFRLDVLRVRAPALHERVQDIPLLATALVREAAKQDGLDPLPLTQGSSTWLQAQTWAGEVRELRGVVQRGLLRAHLASASSIEPHHLTRHDAQSQPNVADLRSATDSFQRAFIQRALMNNEGNRTATARTIGLSRSRLYELMNKLDLV